MTRPFRVTDLLDVLIRLEERGHAFYADLAARTKSDRARALFAQLGDEELQHEALYRDLRKTLEDAPEPERTPAAWTPSSVRALPSRSSGPS